MNSSRRTKLLSICGALTFAFTLFGWAGAGQSLAADSAACTDCHTDQQSAKFVHYPAQEGTCDACHEATPKHLEEGGPGGMKTNRTAAVCHECHDAKDQGKNIHPALEMDDCVQCHNPHGSGNEALLILPKNQLCLECHDPVPAEAAAGSRHDAVMDAESCMNCHDPHSSDNAALLLGSQQTVCLGCHNKDIETGAGEQTKRVVNIKQRLAMPSVHDPATEENGCTNCHAPHGSKYKSLLVAAFPEKIYNRYEAGDGTTGNTYELCFNCHDAGMLNQTIGAGDTGFRNDTARGGAVVRENLHWLHVVDAIGWDGKDRGRSCSICHDPHGTTQPHLVRPWWNMRNYQPILKFESRENGGTCLKSCHTPKTYRRLD